MTKEEYEKLKECICVASLNKCRVALRESEALIKILDELYKEDQNNG